MREIKKLISELKIVEIPSQKKVFDWVIPPEWNIKDAFVVDKYNKKIIDFKKNNSVIKNANIVYKIKKDDQNNIDLVKVNNSLNN